MNNEQNKFKNGGLWVALTAAILNAAGAIALIFGVQIPVEKNEQIIAAVVAVLTVLNILGVVSNPKEGTWFKDE